MAAAGRVAGPAPARWSAVSTAEPLLLVAHGSTDPRFLTVVESVAAQVRALRPGLDVRIGLLEHGPPDVVDVPGAIAVPLLLSGGYHARVDLPQQAPGVRVTAAVGPDPALAGALVDRLAEAGYAGGPVLLAAAGSADPGSLADVRTQARLLTAQLDQPVTAAYVSAGEPRVRDLARELAPAAVAAYLLAPGQFHDQLAACGAPVLSAPLADHPAIAEVVLARYDGEAARPFP